MKLASNGQVHAPALQRAAPLTPNQAAAKIQSSFRGAVAREEVRQRRGVGGGGFRPFTAKPLVTNPFYDRALWMAERASAAFTSAHADTPMLGRQVELLRLQQWVAAQVGLGAARKPGVPAGATKAPTNGVTHGPLLLFSHHGSGKTRLLIALIERLTSENPQLTVCTSFGSIGQGCSDFSRVVLTKLVRAEASSSFHTVHALPQAPALCTHCSAMNCVFYR